MKEEGGGGGVEAAMLEKTILTGVYGFFRPAINPP